MRPGQTHAQEPVSETLRGTSEKVREQRSQATERDMQRREGENRTNKDARDSDILTGRPRGPGEPLGPISPRGPCKEVGP